MALVTQAKAIKALRTATGMSLMWCEAKVRNLATVPDGKRLKVHDWKLENLIRETNEPQPVAKLNGIRPVSRTKAARLRERCI